MRTTQLEHSGLNSDNTPAVLVIGTPTRLIPIQRRQHPEVLRPSSGFLGADHVVQVSNRDLDSLDSYAMGTGNELRIAAFEPGRSEREVEFSVPTDQVPGRGSAERRAVVVERKSEIDCVGANTRVQVLG